MIDENNQAIDKAMDRLGEQWTEESRPAGDFAAEFRRRLALQAPVSAKATVVPVTPTPAPRPARIWALAAAAIILVVLGIGYTVLDAPPAGTLRYRKGNVQSSEVLAAGATIIAREGGTAVAALDKDRVQLHLNSNTELAVLAKDHVRLLRGELWTVVKPNSGHFEVETPQARVVVHGTTFGVSVSDTGTDVVIASGKVSVEVGAESGEIVPGSRATVRVGSARPQIESSAGTVTPDWADALMKAYAESQAARYFPSGAAKKP